MHKFWGRNEESDDDRDRANDGTSEVASPTILASGRPDHQHPWPLLADGGRGVGGGDQRTRRARVDVVKIMSSGGVTTAGTDLLACQFCDDDVRLLIDEAHAAGLPVTVHAHGLPAVKQAIEAGVDGIEHCACLTPSASAPARGSSA